MAVHLYGVLDADGVKINTITADDKQIGTGWYPGYGAYLIDEGELPPDPPPAPPPVKPDTWDTPLPALEKPLNPGDKLDIKSGTVTTAAELAAAAEVVADPIDPVVKE